MKRIITLFFLLTSTLFYSQSSGITYQAVLYNPSGEILPGNNNANAVLSNKDICLRFSITDAQTSLEYQETQKVKTDEFGMVNLLIGSGSQVGGYASNFNTIVWNSHAKKLQVEIDVTGTCANFIEVSNQNFTAVPFAYASKMAENVSGIVAIANGGTGANTVSGAKTNLGLNNVDNTSDADKPISTATQTALDTKAPLASPALTGTPTVPTATLGTNTIQIANTAFVNTAIAAAATPDATATVKGKLQLTGDLAGTADAPRVPGLANKENTIAAGTTSQYFRGDKTWQTLNKAAVGLDNVDNTADADKPISLATQTALNGKESAANKSTNTSLGTSDVLFPTQNAVKTYVDNQVSSGVVDASTSVKGKIQLGGDLGGTADMPTVPGLMTKENTIAAGTTSQYYRGDKTWQTLDKTTVGLPNVDNTADADKPVSTATQTVLALKANSASPTFTGDATAATAITGDNDTSIATTAFVSSAITNAATPNATTATLGKIQLGGDLAGPSSSATVPVITNGAITTLKLAEASVTNAKIGEIVSVNKGGTGSDMSNAGAGYVKQAINGANFTTVAKIPVAEVDGAVRKVNGVAPDTDGNVAVIIGRVFTGATVDPNLATSIINASPAKKSSDIYVVADGSNPNNGRTFIYDGTTWLEVATNLSTTDARYVNVAGDTMEGDLTVPTNKKLILTDAPANATDAANKNYVDSLVAGKQNTITVTTTGSGAASLVGSTLNIPTPNNGTVTNVAALTLGNSGTDITSTVATATTTPVITLNVPTASSANRGALNAADWTTFNDKIGGSGTTNFVPKFSAAKTLTDSSIFDNGTNVGIGTSSPANTLEIKQGTAGNSGLRFTNLNSSSVATTSASKVLGLNSTGDVILTNIPGTQNIVDFSTATPTTSGVVFTPNTPADESVVYQSATDNSLWTYNGTTYVTYTAPSSTAWFTSGTTNDAGNSKTSNIYRTGRVGIGTNNPATNLDVVGGFNLRNTTGATGSNYGIEFNTNANSPRIDWVFNGGYIGQFSSDANNFILQNSKTSTGGFRFVTNPGSGPLDRLNILNNGNVGIGSTAPATKLQLNSSLATNTVNTEGIFRMQRTQNPGVKWENIAQFNLGSYAVTTGGSTSATSRLDLAMNDGEGVSTNNVMTWFANGYVGIGTAAPVSSLSNTATAIQGSNTTNAFNGGLTWSSPGTGFAGSFYSQPANGNGLQIKIAGNTSSNNAFEVSSGATQSGSLTPLFNVLGNGNVGVGTNTPSGTFEIATSNGLSSVIRRYGNTNLSAANLVLQKTYGTTSTTHGAGIVNGDYVGRILFSASNGSSYLTNGTDIVGYAAGIQSATNNGGGIFFRTVPQNSVTQSIERLRIDENGNIGIGTSGPAAQLHTTGSIRFAGAGTPGAGKVLTSDASGNATWQPGALTTTVSNKTTDFSIALTDNGNVIVVNSATTVTATIPSTLPAGFYCQIIQQGAGQVNVIGSGVTVTSALGTFSRTMGSSIGIMLTSSTTAFLSGDTSF